VAIGVFPWASAAALFSLPLLVASGRTAVATFETPRAFVPAVRRIVTCYLAAVLLFTAGVLVSSSS
jgi:1,4-dihydroxy-2-naphthoate polyprenyltransferase